ncbi:MAG: cation:proton antiporter [Micropruina sp.]|uniref:cation:proton antiporter n=1 Tax=Micropruina sp. TaxID=2737536 RepID=UPI0039E5035D
MTSHQIQMLFVGLAAILVVAHVLGRLARSIGQPAVIGELIGGILLGPTVLGPALGDQLFPVGLRGTLSALADVGVGLFMLGLGYELERQSGGDRRGAVVSVAAGSMLVPAVAAVPLGIWLAGRHGAAHTAGFVLFIVAAVAVTAFPVLARIIADADLTRTQVGVIALAAAAIDDVVAWLLLAVALAVSTASAGAAWPMALLPVYAMVMGWVVRPLMRRLLGATGVGTLGLALVLGLALLSGAATEWMGLHFIFGTFVAGLCLPRGRRTASDGREIDIRESLLARITPLATTLLLPAYFVVAGLSVDVRGLQISNLVELIMIVLVAVGGKLIGTFAGARLVGIDSHRASMLASLMNTRGLTELVVLTAGLQAGILDQDLYTLLVLTALGTTAMTGPLLWVIGRWHPRAAALAPSGDGFWSRRSVPDRAKLE